MFYLFVTIIADVAGVTLLSQAKGFERPLHFAFGLLAMVIAFAAFSFATKTMPSGIANAVWSGLSLALVAMIGKTFFGEQINIAQYVFLALIVVGVIGLQIVHKA